MVNAVVLFKVKVDKINEVAQALFATAGGERALRGNLWYGWSEGDDGW